jgi:RNA polymerase sigma-32 factor
MVSSTKTSFALAQPAGAAGGMTYTNHGARDPFAVVPSLGNLDAYISAVNRIPLLTLEQEQQMARDFRANGDVNAAGQMVLSHLRLVVSLSRQYLGYGLPHADLIQEGNIGLMKAVKRFDPDQNVRLVSYAMHWIKAEIHEYVMKNWRLVKIATTKAQRKLFFNLRSMKGELDSHGDSLSDTNIEKVAKNLNVKRSDVIEMEARFAGGDVAIDGGTTDDGEEAYAPIAYLADTTNEPVQVLANRQRDALQSEGITQALESLDERSRRIVSERWLRDNDDGGSMTLHELAAEYGVSAERIRQIEVAAMKKMRSSLEAFA